MPAKIQAAFQRLVADGEIDRTDAQQLITTAKDWGFATQAEKQKLKELLTTHTDRFSYEAKVDLHRFLGLPPPSGPSPSPSTGPSIDLGTNPSGEAIFFKDGFFVRNPDAPVPTQPKEIGDAIYGAASLIADTDPGTNVFAALDTAQKTQLFEKLETALRMVPPSEEVPQGYDNALQAKQQRASVGTTMLELLRSMDTGDTQQRLLQDNILKTYAHMARHETSGLLRDSMVFQLHNNKDCLVTPAQREISNELMRLFAPTTPPYDEWFKDGNNTLNVVCHTGSEFFSTEVDRWKGAGFSVVEERSGKVVLEQSIERNGVETKVRLTMRSGSSGTFDEMDDPNTHIVAYSGHASWGRNIPQALRGAPGQVGKKLVLIHQCCGRGIVNEFRDQYPDSQLITTRNSSYETEDFNTFFKTIEGIAERRAWVSIAKQIREDRWNNRRDNYNFPSDVLARLRACDRDHDGINDVVDRLVTFNAFRVKTDTDDEFTAKDPGKPPDQLDGTIVHRAAQIMNTTTTFSDFMEHHGTGESFLGSGYFAPQNADDPMVKIKTSNAGGQNSYKVEVNAHFAHTSEEAVKAEAFFTVAHTPPFRVATDSKLDACLKALVLVAHSLSVDNGYRDREIFTALLERHGLPAINLSAVSPCVDMNHVYAGSAASILKLKENLGPDRLAELEAALV